MEDNKEIKEAILVPEINFSACKQITINRAQLTIKGTSLVSPLCNTQRKTIAWLVTNTYQTLNTVCCICTKHI